MLDINICQQARISRDPRFDGIFFIGVVTTKIFCRTICPAKLPLEKNVIYFNNAADALRAGFRPCLRCKPDSLPHSFEWDSKSFLLNQVIRVLQSGELNNKKLYQLCQELHISSRYLHKMFTSKLGMSPKKYEIYYKCFLAKQLIQETTLPIGEIAYACGFSSISQFNNTFKQQTNMTPTSLRRHKTVAINNHINLKLNYQPPYDWQHFLHFQSARVIEGLEFIHKQTYGRNFIYKDVKGHFTIKPHPTEHYLQLSLTLDDWSVLQPVLANIRRMFDLDSNLQQIENLLKDKIAGLAIHSGLRIPGVWSLFEAGIRAICGQQVSVAAATTMVKQIIQLAGTQDSEGRYYFPTPQQLSEFDYNKLKTTQRRKETLKVLADYCLTAEFNHNPNDWLSLKGIGPWSVDYAKLRAMADPDIWLAADLGIKKALIAQQIEINADKCKPWRSYLTLQLWRSLNV